ncbi:MAG: ABC transporter ATP-binding protein [Leucobacter sp.]
MTRNNASIEVVGLTKEYPGAARPAVDNISLTIEPGEFLTLLGPSGSGKTTTLNIIAGFETATSGSVAIAGKDVLGIPSHRRNLGVVFQNYALFPHMTVFENIAFPLRQRKFSKQSLNSEVERMLDILGLTELADRTPGQLSGGQQQRVALGRALVFGPSVLLMDEPLGALDKKLREQLQIEIARIHREIGTTVVFVTHDQEEALALSDRIAIYNEGKILQCGRPTELYNNPANTFVAEFLGDSNIFRGTVTQGQTGSSLSLPGGVAQVPSSAHGEACELLVRPERVVVSIGDLPTHPDNYVAGTVSSITYQGSYRKVRVELADGRFVMAREGMAQASDCHPGEPVILSWDERWAVPLGSR